MSARNVVTFGSRLTILFARISQCALALFFIAFMFDEHSIVSWVSIGFPFLIFQIYMSGMVLATLSEDGLSYRRWATWKQVRWAEMTYGGVAPFGFIRVRLVGLPLWRRYLLLRAPDPPLEDQEASLPGARRFCEVMEPPSGRTN